MNDNFLLASTYGAVPLVRCSSLDVCEKNNTFARIKTLSGIIVSFWLQLFTFSALQDARKDPGLLLVFTLKKEGTATDASDYW